MRECGGFLIQAKHEKHKEELFAAFKEFLDNYNFLYDDFWAEYVTENQAGNLEVDYETHIDHDDYAGENGVLFVEMCTEVASNLPKIPFKGVSHYCNENAGFNEDYIVHYDGKRHLTIYYLEYFDGSEESETMCPECGGNILSELWDGTLTSVVPDTVYCNECQKTFKLKDVAIGTEVKL